MSNYEVPEPILNSPFEEPREHWHIEEGETPERRPGRRKAMYFYRDPKARPEGAEEQAAGTAIEMKLVNLVRQRLAAWRTAGYPGVTRTSHELLQWWRRDPRVFQYLELDPAPAYSGGARREKSQPEAGGHSEVRPSPHRHAGGFMGKGMR